MGGTTTATSYFMHILCIYLYVSPTYQSRKYDIEAESLKLYKEDLATVLLRFRRSPEYIKILEEKSAEFEIYSGDVKNQITYFYLDQLEKKIAEMLGYNMDKNEEDPNDGAGGDGQSGAQFKAGRRAEEDPNNITGVERLDSYHKLSSTMSLAQRNSMRDLGFQYAGHIIHALIKNMGPDRTEGKSTKTGGVATTEHVSIHSVAFVENEESAAPIIEEHTNPAEPEQINDVTPQTGFRKENKKRANL